MINNSHCQEDLCLTFNCPAVVYICSFLPRVEIFCYFSNFYLRILVFENYYDPIFVFSLNKLRSLYMPFPLILNDTNLKCVWSKKRKKKFFFLKKQTNKILNELSQILCPPFWLHNSKLKIYPCLPDSEHETRIFHILI